MGRKERERGALHARRAVEREIAEVRAEVLRGEPPELEAATLAAYLVQLRLREVNRARKRFATAVGALERARAEAEAAKAALLEEVAEMQRLFPLVGEAFDAFTRAKSEGRIASVEDRGDAWEPPEGVERR